MKGLYSIVAKEGRYITLSNRRQTLIKFLGDELIIKDLINNALIIDKSKRVSPAQEITYIILNFYYILKIFIWCERRLIERQFEGEYGRVFYLNNCFDPRDIVIYEIRDEFDKDSYNKIISLIERKTDIILIIDID